MISRPEKTILTCAITGAITDPNSTPYLPITPAEIADSALEAAEAGAAVVHLHVRDPVTKRMSTDTALYVKTVELIRKANPDIIINLTTGPGANFIPSQHDLSDGREHSRMRDAVNRTAHITAIRPEICSLDFNTMHNAGNSVRLNYIPVLKQMCHIINQAGTKPELECFDSGDIRIAKELQAEGLIEANPLWQFAMGIKYGWDHTPEALTYARSTVPHDALWSAFGIGREEMPMVASTWLLGGHVRVGLEDNIYLSKGVLAKSNAELVIKARQIVENLGGQLANYAEARNILNLPSRSI